MGLIDKNSVLSVDDRKFSDGEAIEPHAVARHLVFLTVLASHEKRTFRNDNHIRYQFDGHDRSNEDGKRLETPDSFDRQITILPFQHPALEVRDMLEAETREDSCGGSAAHAGATNRDDVRVFVSLQFFRARS